MTTLLLHVSKQRRSTKQQQSQQQSKGNRRPYSSTTPIGRIRQPGLAAFAHYFAFSRVALGRYTPALAADLPSQTTMSAVDTQAAPALNCFRQLPHQQQCKTKSQSYFNCQKQQKQQQQLQKKLGSIARSYSDPDLPSSNSAAQFNYKDSPLSSSLKSPLDYSMESPNYVAVFKVDCENQSTGLAPPLMFRHSFDCLLDLLNGHGERDGEGDGEGRGNGEVEAEPQPAPAAAAEATAAEATAADVLTVAGGPPLHKAVSDSIGKSMKKRVIFADDAGKPLQQVRVFSEPSWAPPKFLSIRPLPADPDAADDIEYSSDKSGQFRCQFAQPSSKYILFRENVEKNCVSLSNLYFDGLTAKGSVSVKNISFKKRVFVRVSFDQWASYRDFDATYASSQDSRQDSFVFSFPCPADLERGFEFCVCFEAEGQAFWDSNLGANYKVSVAKKSASSKSSRPANAYTSDYKPNYSGVTDFSEFSVWDHFADRVYY
ncbi:hypothetical protein BOX15_Mlig015760g1 [Macrostomum lignano]|uniref:CBM21 domain-containing protein n=1 Tax=Macrostomum lignano TaxID=282301 RepID=A0A267EX38_9PLAT|nr:hypothetical protein BOX15_Mlig015760g1 [Macrostomum lignano]